MRTREPTYLSVGFGDFFAIIWINRNVKLEKKRPDQKWRNKDKLRQGKVHRSGVGLSLKRRRCFVRWYLTINSLLPDRRARKSRAFDIAAANHGGRRVAWH
ncbi:MAG: hypothetical protein WCC81_19380 [Pseudolabrys sp.]